MTQDTTWESDKNPIKHHTQEMHIYLSCISFQNLVLKLPCQNLWGHICQRHMLKKKVKIVTLKQTFFSIRFLIRQEISFLARIVTKATEI